MHYKAIITHILHTFWTPDKSFFNPVTVWYRILFKKKKEKKTIKYKN